MFHNTFNIGGKNIYVVESHHHVLRGCAEVRRSQPSSPPPALLTLDHYTDLEEPFDDHRFYATHQRMTNQNAAAKKSLLPGMIAAIDCNIEATVEAAIDKLKHDEHIRTAVQAGTGNVNVILHGCTQDAEAGGARRFASWRIWCLAARGGSPSSSGATTG